MTTARRLALSFLVAAAAASPLVVSTPAARAEDDAAPASQPARVDPIDFRKMKEALPTTLAGLKREEATGSKNKFGDVAISQAEADYGKDEGDAPRTAKVTAIDYSQAEVAQGMAIWMATDIDNESDNEWTKTADVQGRKALLTYNTADKHGSLQTLAGGRIMVQYEIHNVSDAEFKKSLEELPLKKLDALVPAAK